MKLGVYGGTFNPFHKGHLNLCKQCRQLLALDKLLVIPTNIPPHKQSGDMASNKDRLAMLFLATKSDDFIEISDIEFRLSGISYTYNTLVEIKRAYKGAEIYLIIGSDMFCTFNKWYRYTDILEIATVVVGAREDNQFQALLQLKQEQYANSPAISIVNIPALPMSSTEVRERIKDGKPLDAYLDSTVLNYIKANKLYNESEVE